MLALVRKYWRAIGLTNWDISVQFAPDPDGAACSADDEYLRATLTFDLARIPAGEEAEFVRHELLHAVTWELLRVAEHLAGDDRIACESVRAANERCTTLLERMPVWRLLA